MPRLPLFFARRYLFSRKSHSVINIISGVSAFSVAVPVMAMVVLLSVFNGFEGLIKTMYRSFDPDLAIMPARGQVFATDSVPRDELLRIDGVREVSYSLDGNALLEYRGHQFFGMIRGVDSLYAEVVPVDSMTVEGQYRLRFGDMPEAFVGQGVASALGVRTGLSSPITVYVPRRGRVSPLVKKPGAVVHAFNPILGSHSYLSCYKQTVEGCYDDSVAPSFMSSIQSLAPTC